MNINPQNLSRFKPSDPNANVVLKGSTLIAILDAIAALTPKNGKGYRIVPVGGGWTIEGIQGSARGSGSTRLPFQLVTNGTTADDDSDSTGDDDEKPKPKVKVLAGYIITTNPISGEATYTLISEGLKTMDGAEHTEYKAWLDLQTNIIGFGEDWPVNDTPVANQFRYLHIATFDTSAEDDSGETFVPSAVSNITQIIIGFIPPLFMPRHDHSTVGAGGNKLQLIDDLTDTLGAEPEFKVGSDTDIQDYIFPYSSGAKRGLKAKYKSRS